MGETNKYDIRNKNVAIFYKSLEFMGGIERVIIELINILRQQNITNYDIITSETHIQDLLCRKNKKSNHDTY